MATLEKMDRLTFNLFTMATLEKMDRSTYNCTLATFDAVARGLDVLAAEAGVDISTPMTYLFFSIHGAALADATITVADSPLDAGVSGLFVEAGTPVNYKVEAPGYLPVEGTVTPEGANCEVVLWMTAPVVAASAPGGDDAGTSESDSVDE